MLLDPTLENQIRSSTKLMSLASQLSLSNPDDKAATTAASDASSIRTGSDDEGEDGGEGEIRVLAKRVLDLLEGNVLDD